MGDKVTSSDLLRIEARDVTHALERLAAEGSPVTFAESTRYDLLHKGRRFPTKAVVAFAIERTLGRVPGSGEFSGGEASASTRVLLDRGFEIVTKQAKVGDLDATFSVGRGRDEEFLIVEARGPSRNADYQPGLEALLAGLASHGIRILDAFVDSTTTRDLPRSESRLQLDGRGYPLVVREEPDVTVLARLIGAAAARTAREPGAGGGGNPTKRLRLVLEVPEALSLSALSVALAGSSVEVPGPKRAFEFVSSKPGLWESVTRRVAVQAVDVSLIHKEMQIQLYERLATRHGQANVACEHRTASGMQADLMVKTDAGLEIYEVKTATTPRECVRQALGQLLEYGCWPGATRLSRLFVVGPRPVDGETEQFLALLRDRYQIPVEYLCQPEAGEKTDVSDKGENG